ncbi:MAG: hypothetical protein LBI17_02965 [Rickettsiales bacterium]|jgi:hypothetical protein|nr:hypothetical protein [Rickettsiales bacterium]
MQANDSITRKEFDARMRDMERIVNILDDKVQLTEFRLRRLQFIHDMAMIMYSIDKSLAKIDKSLAKDATLPANRIARDSFANQKT